MKFQFIKWSGDRWAAMHPDAGSSIGLGDTKFAAARDLEDWLSRKLPVR